MVPMAMSIGIAMSMLGAGAPMAVVSELMAMVADPFAAKG